MRLEHGELSVERLDPGWIRLADDKEAIPLEIDDMRWLAFVALPAMLSAMPAEQPKPDEPVPGQLAIE